MTMNNERSGNDAAIDLIETPDKSLVTIVEDDEAQLSFDDALAITDMLDNPAEELAKEPSETLRYGRTLWMESVGPLVKLGAAGLRREIQVDTGRQMPVDVRHRIGIGRQALGAGRLQKQIYLR